MNVLQAVQDTGTIVGGNVYAMVFVGMAVAFMVIKSLVEAGVWVVTMYRAANGNGNGNGNGLKSLAATKRELEKIAAEVQQVHDVVTREDPNVVGHMLVWGLRPELAERLIKTLEDSAKFNQASIQSLREVKAGLAEFGSKMERLEGAVLRKEGGAA
jgi:hypothetical protein